MARISHKRHRFPPAVIQHAVWFYFRFTLSFRDLKELLARRGIEVSYETVHCWTIKFGPLIAGNLQRRRQPSSPRWHLDEMVCTIGGERVYLWRAVDDEGEVLDLVVQKRSNTGAAVKLLQRLLHNQCIEPKTIVTDGLKSYDATLRVLGLEACHRPGQLHENAHLPIRRRERKMQALKSLPSTQRILTTHVAIYNAFDFQRHIISQPTLRPLRGRANCVWNLAAA